MRRLWPLPSKEAPAFPSGPSYNLYHLRIVYVSCGQPSMILRTMQGVHMLTRDS